MACLFSQRALLDARQELLEQRIRNKENSITKQDRNKQHTQKNQIKR